MRQRPYSRQSTASIKSSKASSKSQPDVIEETVVQGKYEEYESSPARVSPDHERASNNVLARIASRITNRTQVEPPPAPDGGLAAWTQVAMAWLVIFCSWGFVNAYGPFQTLYSAPGPFSLGVSASTVSWIGSVQNWCTFFLGAFSGRLLDAGLFRPTLVVGVVIQLIGIFTMSVSTKYWQLMITQGILTGVGNGIFFTPSMGVVGTYFSRKRALAVGIATTGNSVGGMVYPVLVQQLLPKIGFAWTVRVLGFLNLGLLCIAIAFMRPRLPPRTSGPLVDFSAFKELPYALFVAGLFFAIWPVYYTFYYISSFGNEAIGLPFSTATTIVIVINGAGLPARVIPPFFADRFGQLNTVVPTLAALTVVAFCWLAITDATGIWVFTCFYGIFSAGFQCLIPSTVASLTPDMKMFGTRLGMAFSTLSFAALTGPPIGGALQSAAGGSFVAGTIWAAVSTAICVGFVLAARVAKGGWKLGVKC